MPGSATLARKRPPQRAVAMIMDAPGGEVGGDAEEWQRQFLDADIAEMFAQPVADLLAPHQRDQRKGEIR